MNWIKSSDQSIKSKDGRFHIAKSGIESPMFCLWDGQKLIGCYHSAEMAKKVAEDAK